MTVSLTYQRKRQHQLTKQRGVALAMLLWFIAAMAILVAGIVAQSKTDIKLAQLQLQQLQAEAAGDGASLLLLADLMLLQEQEVFSGRGIFEQTYTLGVHDVRIRAVPASGLINLNLAGEALLASLFSYGAGLNEEQANHLVTNVISWRGEGAELAEEVEEAEQNQPRNGRFEVVEDLLQVEGVDREIYDRISSLVYVAQRGLHGVDPLSAPEEVLNMLVGEDTGQVAEMVLKRSQMPFEDSGTGSMINDDYIVAETLSLFRLDAIIKFNDGKIYRRTRWVEMGGVGMDGLPWRFIRTEPAVIAKVESVLMVEGDHGRD